MIKINYQIVTLFIIFCISNVFSQTNAPPMPVTHGAEGDVYETHTISLTEGWSGISSYINPNINNLDTIFNEVLDELIILEGQNGIYWPSQNINTLGAWNTNNGYKIKVSQDTEIKFYGANKDSKTINLKVGWNLIPVLAECNFLVNQVLSSPSILIVKEVANVGIFWPEYSINTLETLKSGDAYLTFATSPISISYPECFGSGELESKNKSFSPNMKNGWAVSSFTPITHVMAIKEEATVNLKGLQILGAFSSEGQCYGISDLSKQDGVIMIFGDDYSTSLKDGFKQDEIIQFRLFNKVTNEKRNALVEFEQSYPLNSSAFIENGLSVINNIKLGEIIEGEQNEWHLNIFPNPTNRLLNIVSNSEQQYVIFIFDIQGGECLSKKVWNQKTSIDISTFDKGLYTVVCKSKEKILHKKLIVK
jgi:hypothetical protein